MSTENIFLLNTLEAGQKSYESYVWRMVWLISGYKRLIFMLLPFARKMSLLIKSILVRDQIRIAFEACDLNNQRPQCLLTLLRYLKSGSYTRRDQLLWFWTMTLTRRELSQL